MKCVFAGIGLTCNLIVLTDSQSVKCSSEFADMSSSENLTLCGEILRLEEEGIAIKMTRIMSELRRS